METILVIIIIILLIILSNKTDRANELFEMLGKETALTKHLEEKIHTLKTLPVPDMLNFQRLQKLETFGAVVQHHVDSEPPDDYLREQLAILIVDEISSKLIVESKYLGYAPPEFDMIEHKTKIKILFE